MKPDSQVDILERGWYHVPEAEQSVLGAVMLEPDAMDEIADVLTPDDFFESRHQAIFRAMQRQYDRGQTCDMVLISEQLQRSGERVRVELTYLGELMQLTPSARNVRRYAEIVRERSMLRRLVGALRTIEERVGQFTPADSARALVDEAQAKVMALTDSAQRSEFRDVQSVLTEVVEFIDTQFHKEATDGVTGTPTGFIDLDRMTTGMHPGQLIILAARPAMGKSALSLNIAEHAARVTQHPALIVSLEMGARELGIRLVGGGAQVNVQRLVTGRIRDDEWARVTTAISRLQEAPMLFYESASPTSMELRAIARRAKHRSGNLSVIVVDYLQLMGADGHENNRVAQLSEISRGLKQLARELSVPVIALSQLNREVEKRPNKRPVLSDLRESGSIEQDADVVMFIYRDEVYNPDTAERGLAEVIISKQRNGPIGTCRLHFRGDHTRFSNYTSAASV